MADPVATIRAAWRREPASAVVEASVRATGHRAWIVGGAARDCLLGRKVSDWDLLCDDAMAVALELAARTGGRLVVLHEHPMTCRVVPGPGPGDDRCLDLVGFRGATLRDDLAGRDFTVNALAVALPDGPLSDPFGGLPDLRSGVIRTVAATSLAADPLRCLRAYRFHSELGFSIEPATREWLREVGPRLPEVAGERLGVELLKLLQPPRAAQALRLMAADGALWALLPELAATRGVFQGGYHHLDVWGHSSAVVAHMERLLTGAEPVLPRNAEAVAEYLSVAERRPMLLLAALLHDVSKPACRATDEAGHTRFLGHEAEGSRVASHIAQRLALGNEMRHSLQRLVRNHLRPLLLANTALPGAGQPAQGITLSALRRLFRDAGPDAVGLVLLAIADVHGCRGPAARPGYQQAVTAVLDDMLERYRAWEAEAAQQPLLRGSDLIAAGYQPSPAFGRALRAVDEARAEGQVTTTAEALELARRHLSHEGNGPAESELAP